MKKNIEFDLAKSGDKTCKFHGIYIHSKYDPIKEAERFVNKIECNFTPAVVIIIEPGLPYCASLLKLRFKKSQIMCIHFVEDFSLYDKAWDKVFYFNNQKRLTNDIFSYLGEEKLFSLLCVSWPASEKIFYDKNFQAYQSIKNSLLLSRDLIATRVHFNKRWILNTIRFFKLVHRTAQIIPGSQTVLLAASGPSLLDSISFIKNNRANLFLVAVSSACNALLYRNIIPDLVISTDGGYYAKKHLECIIDKNIPIILSAESSFPSQLTSNTTIIPICYGDGIETMFFKLCSINALNASRNGSVSGTAIELLLKLSRDVILTTGLDLESNKGFVHVAPNKLELIDNTHDNRLKTTSSRLASNSFESSSLEIYRNWFAELDAQKKARIYRLFSNPNSSRKIMGIQDISFAKAQSLINLRAKKIQISDFVLLDQSIIKPKIINFLTSLQNNISDVNYLKFMESAALSEILLAKKYPNNKDYLNIAKKKTGDLINSLINNLNNK